jgi:hypothetical protein
MKKKFVKPQVRVIKAVCDNTILADSKLTVDQNGAAVTSLSKKGGFSEDIWGE